MGGHRPIVWGGKSDDKKIWRPLVDHFTHNNQPKTDARDGGEYGEDVQPGGRHRQSAIATFGGIKI